MNTYICPVCGFKGMETNTEEMETLLTSFVICNCCGTEFGSPDVYNGMDGGIQGIYNAIEELRKSWIENGHNWFTDYCLPPEDWNWIEDLKSIGVDVSKYTSETK